MKLLYFAWVRQRIGLAEEEVTPPANVVTVGELVEWLRGRGPGYAAAFANPAVVKAAVNQEFAHPDRRLAPGDEIALFPPMTGG
ncbi:MAG: molybdopterin converting factor subunit 1 [Alphaproteobacteria bacterium]|nr:molybdopterin converting factor subunit 1 [Alphaproteobacteria bacterium]